MRRLFGGYQRIQGHLNEIAVLIDAVPGAIIVAPEIQSVVILNKSSLRGGIYTTGLCQFFILVHYDRYILFYHVFGGGHILRFCDNHIKINLLLVFFAQRKKMFKIESRAGTIRTEKM